MSLLPTQVDDGSVGGSQQQKIVTIELPNDGRRGFGFSVVSQGDSKTLVHSVVAGGIAEQVRVTLIKPLSALGWGLFMNTDGTLYML